MLPRLKTTIVLIGTFLGFMNVLSPALADPIDGVVGTGTAGSCTSAAALDDLQDEINDGGLITFNCGGAVTIPVTTTLEADADVGAINATIDGGGLVTLDGQDVRRIFFQRTWGFNGSTLTLQNITLMRGRASGSGTAANGGAILSRFEAANPSLEPILNVDNVTFTNNVSNLTSATSGDYGGAAIYSQLGMVNVSDSVFSNNSATGGSGAAIHILQSGLTIANTTFTNNTATHQGGSIYIDGVGSPTGVVSITDSTFTGSRSWYSGGAIYVNMYENTNSFTVDRTSFINNGVNGGDRAQGGAICGGSTTAGAGTGNASITITNSLFSNNFVDRPGTADGSGGALNFNQRARITIANSTFDGNRAEGNSFGANGGAIFIINNINQFEIINSTISNNFAGWVGGGVVAGALPGNTPGGIIRNTIFANNTADNGPNDWNISHHCGSIDVGGGVAIPMLVNGGNNIQFPAKLTTNWNDQNCATGITIANPLLDPLANNGGPTQTRAPQPTSPAIDFGSNAVCAATPISNLDQRGEPRPVDGDGLSGAQCDAGAFEFVPNQPPLAPSLTLPADGAMVTGTTVALSWGQAPFATQYRLQVDDDSNFSSPIVNQLQTGTSYTPAYLSVGVFHWRVESINGNGSAMSAVRSFTLNSSSAAVPTRNFTIGANQTLTWSPLTWAIGYQVEVATDSVFNNILATSPILASNTVEYTVSLSPGVYYWRVKGQKPDATWGTPNAGEILTVGSG